MSEQGGSTAPDPRRMSPEGAPNGTGTDSQRGAGEFWDRSLARLTKIGTKVWTWLVSSPNTLFTLLIAAASALFFPWLLDVITADDVSLAYELSNDRKGGKEELVATVYSSSNVVLPSMGAELRLQFKGNIESIKGPRRLATSMYSEECFADANVTVLYHLTFGGLSPHGELDVKIISKGQLERIPGLIHGGEEFGMSSCEGNREFQSSICTVRVAQKPVDELERELLDKVDCPR